MVSREDDTQEKLDYAMTTVTEQLATNNGLAKRVETRSLIRSNSSEPRPSTMKGNQPYEDHDL